MQQKQTERKKPIFPQLWGLFLALCLFFVFLSESPRAAYAAKPLPDLSHASAVLLYNVDYDKLLCEKNADTKRPPTSTVKIMTGLIAIERLRDRFDETVTVTETMLKGVSGNRMKLEKGETIAIRDLLYGAITGGYNDACLVLSHVVSGSAEGFVAEMNAKARSLGMQNTLYENPTGMHSSAMLTTARDTLTLSKYALRNSLYMEISSTVKHSVPSTNKSEARTFYNRNYLISSYVTNVYFNSYARGLNAGMTNEGGYCLSTSITSTNGMHYLCVVLGGEEGEDGRIYAYDIANELLTYAARSFEPKEIITSGKAYGSLPVRYAAIDSSYNGEGIPVIAYETVSALIPKTADEDGLTYAVLPYRPELEAPVKRGDEVGVLVAYFDGEEISRTSLYASVSIGRDGFTYALSVFRGIWKNRTFLIGLSVFVLLSGLYLYLILIPNRPYLKKRKRHRRRF